MFEFKVCGRCGSPNTSEDLLTGKIECQNQDCKNEGFGKKVFELPNMYIGKPSVFGSRKVSGLVPEKEAPKLDTNIIPPHFQTKNY